MPLYEYRCEECGQAFEQLRRMEDADRELVCPNCRSGRVERQLSTFASRAGSGAAAPCGAPSSKACGTGRFT